LGNGRTGKTVSRLKNEEEERFPSKKKDEKKKSQVPKSVSLNTNRAAKRRSAVAVSPSRNHR